MALRNETVAAKSQAIAERLKTAADWPAVRALHCFQPLTALHEPDITGFLEYVAAQHPEISVYTSRKYEGEWRIVTLDGRKGQAPEFDVVITPMLGFDDALHRIGYGGGYYDRLLAAQPQARKIGVCFEIGHTGSLPYEPHDIPMDVVITDRRTA